MPIPEIFTKHPKRSVLLTGTIFLFGYWIFAFDGITFSDDVYYLRAGRDFWRGTMVFDSYHFSTRWGAYVPAGLLGAILGFDAHRISFISLISYWGTLVLLVRLLPNTASGWVLLMWFSTQVYFLHFLTKIYPDSLLVFWTVLVPFSAVYRKEKPSLAALGMISGMFFGFLTKETIIFLAPFPVLLWMWDSRNKNSYDLFYFRLLGFGLIFGLLYLGYFGVKFGSPFYRFQSIQEGHYISEFTYADKSIWVMLKRLTILPILTFVERSYWLWIVFAIPALVKIRRNPISPGVEFGLVLLSLMICFWFMTTNFKFYNPLYLNPRHLIILSPILAFLIAYGWEEWQKSERLQRAMLILIGIGISISLVQQDWKMVGFQLGALLITFAKRLPYRNFAFALLLLIPALAAPVFQRVTKNYSLLVSTLKHELDDPDSPRLLLTHSFINFSKEVILPDDAQKLNRIWSFEHLDSLKKIAPDEFTVIVYRFYEKAYPDEQRDLDVLELWLKSEYTKTEGFEEGLIEVSTYRRK